MLCVVGYSPTPAFIPCVNYCNLSGVFTPHSCVNLMLWLTCVSRLNGVQLSCRLILLWFLLSVLGVVTQLSD